MADIERAVRQKIAENTAAGDDETALWHHDILEVLRGRREQVVELRQQLEGAVSRDALHDWLTAWVDQRDAGDGTDEEALIVFDFIAELRAVIDSGRRPS